MSNFVVFYKVLGVHGRKFLVFYKAWCSISSYLGFWGCLGENALYFTRLDVQFHCTLQGFALYFTRLDVIFLNIWRCFEVAWAHIPRILRGLIFNFLVFYEILRVRGRKFLVFCEARFLVSSIWRGFEGAWAQISCILRGLMFVFLVFYKVLKVLEHKWHLFYEAGCLISLYFTKFWGCLSVNSPYFMRHDVQFRRMLRGFEGAWPQIPCILRGLMSNLIVLYKVLRVPERKFLVFYEAWGPSRDPPKSKPPGSG